MAGRALVSLHPQESYMICTEATTPRTVAMASDWQHARESPQRYIGRPYGVPGSALRRAPCWAEHDDGRPGRVILSIQAPGLWMSVSGRVRACNISRVWGCLYELQVQALIGLRAPMQEVPVVLMTHGRASTGRLDDQVHGLYDSHVSSRRAFEQYR
ncbi:hypothetical protein PYCCODRAFT_1144023 [Trametes coccinea BRFM310]|uniref:Uncharacterized protein n=1 Tax=Trametes coccinea (strain BRFM310) TaxID=1353009 RepID=A0A1Y2IAA0_TRAC3|nr:hypothetical protein PYCCODRAFT_1144023 [Trametes coccinea BRFM310]